MKLKRLIAKTFGFLLVFLQSTLLQAQSPEMADVMRSNGKIYVVVAVLTVIFVGIIVYLIAIDRKVGRLENEIEDIKK